jgi:hypothetical protein
MHLSHIHLAALGGVERLNENVAPSVLAVFNSVSIMPQW